MLRLAVKLRVAATHEELGVFNTVKQAEEFHFQWSHLHADNDVRPPMVTYESIKVNASYKAVMDE